MKNQLTLWLCVCAFLYSHCATAQTNKIPLNEPNLNKSRLFSSLPDHIAVSADVFNMLLKTEVGNTVTIPISNASKFQGLLVSSISKYENAIQTVVIRLNNYAGANLTLSKISNQDGSIYYAGRILSLEHGDLYELQNTNGEYSFVKKKFYELINE